MKPLPGNILGSQQFTAFLTDLAALGVQPVITGGRRFAVIAARSNPRWWLLPLDNRRAAAAGLEMLQPVTRAAQAAKTMARGMARFGLHRFLGCGQLRLSGMPDMGNAFSGREAYMACFTGTDGPHRKTALQVMDVHGAILGYVKLSRAPHIRVYLRHEADMLARVARLGLSTANVPSILATQDDRAMTLLITDSLKSATHVSPRILGTQHMAFLADLRARTGHPEAHGALDRLGPRTAALTGTTGREWTARMARVEAVLRPHAGALPVCLAHGDFTPWNTFIQGGRLYVFDWEYAHTAWPVGFDLVHFNLATTPRAAQPSRLSALTRALANAYFAGDEVRAGRALLLSLACHAVFYLDRLQEVESPLSTWMEGPTRAEMIDRLLASMTETS